MGLFGWLKQQRRIADLEEQVGKLVRVVGDRDLDWADMRARCKRLLDRTEKAQRYIDSKAEGVESEELVQNGSGGIVATTHGLLTDRQKQIQQQVLKRRAGG
jgi:hypothetical protein